MTDYLDARCSAAYWYSDEGFYQWNDMSDSEQGTNA